MGSDLRTNEEYNDCLVFQSTLPAWGATGAFLRPWKSRSISIHAPRMGSDHQQETAQGNRNHFNPRSPHGERPGMYKASTAAAAFQSTLPAWGATATRGSRGSTRRISIHAPRMGSDILLSSRRRRPTHFNPRSPHGERLGLGDGGFIGQHISIHAPRMGSDKAIPNQRFNVVLFQSTLPAWGATIFRHFVP